MAAEIRLRVLLLVFPLLGMALGMLISGDANRAELPRAQLQSIPLDLPPFAGEELRFDTEILDVLQADQTRNLLYRDGGERYWLFVGYFAHQGFGRQIHSPRHCYPGNGWNILTTESTTLLPDPAGELLIQKGGERRAVLFQYRTRRGSSASELDLKWALALAALTGKPRDAAFIRFSTSMGKQESMEEATLRLGEFARRVEPYLTPALKLESR